MVIQLHANTKLWEAVAVVQVAQAAVSCVIYDGTDPWIFELLALGDVLPAASVPHEEIVTPDLNAVYREVEDIKDAAYHAVLARHLGYTALEVKPPVFPSIPPSASATGGIILAPMPLRQDLELAFPVWKHVVRFLRTFGLAMWLAVPPAERMDPLAYAEDEMLCRRYATLRGVLTHIQTSTLIVGVPNEWTWLATAFYKKMVILYPDNMSQKKWFPMHHINFGRIGFPPHALQIPVLLTGLRTLLRML